MSVMAFLNEHKSAIEKTIPTWSQYLNLYYPKTNEPEASATGNSCAPAFPSRSYAIYAVMPHAQKGPFISMMNGPFC